MRFSWSFIAAILIPAALSWVSRVAFCSPEEENALERSHRLTGAVPKPTPAQAVDAANQARMPNGKYPSIPGIEKLKIPPLKPGAARRHYDFLVGQKIAPNGQRVLVGLICPRNHPISGRAGRMDLRPVLPPVGQGKGGPSQDDFARAMLANLNSTRGEVYLEHKVDPKFVEDLLENDSLDDGQTAVAFVTHPDDISEPWEMLGVAHPDREGFLPMGRVFPEFHRPPPKQPKRANYRARTGHFDWKWVERKDGSFSERVAMGIFIDEEGNQRLGFTKIPDQKPGWEDVIHFYDAYQGGELEFKSWVRNEKKVPKDEEYFNEIFKILEDSGAMWMGQKLPKRQQVTIPMVIYTRQIGRLAHNYGKEYTDDELRDYRQEYIFPEQYAFFAVNPRVAALYRRMGAKEDGTAALKDKEGNLIKDEEGKEIIVPRFVFSRKQIEQFPETFLAHRKGRIFTDEAEVNLRPLTNAAPLPCAREGLSKATEGL